jgi:hypothetical protein
VRLFNGYIFIKKIGSCINYPIEYFLTNGLIKAYPNQAPGTISVLNKNTYAIDYNSGRIGTASNSTRTSITTIGNNCTCNGFVKEIHYYYILSSNYSMINSVFTDIVLANGITGECSERAIINQKYSVKFLQNYTVVL